MLPEDKKQLTTMLSGYISAHKLGNTADFKTKKKLQDGSVMFGLTNSQVEQFSAIKKYPSEKVINLLKNRDKVRKIRQEAS